MTDRFAQIVAKLANKVPADIPLLFHFCYGDANHKHAIEPTDMGDMVAMANALFAHISRRVNLIHMPVPRDRNDDAYFTPMARLQKPVETALVLGSRALYGRSGGNAGAHRHRITFRTSFLRRHRVRLRAPRSGDDTGAPRRASGRIELSRLAIRRSGASREGAA
jgi:hypothetical protein